MMRRTHQMMVGLSLLQRFPNEVSADFPKEYGVSLKTKKEEDWEECALWIAQLPPKSRTMLKRNPVNMLDAQTMASIQSEYVQRISNMDSKNSRKQKPLWPDEVVAFWDKHQLINKKRNERNAKNNPALTIEAQFNSTYEMYLAKEAEWDAIARQRNNSGTEED